MADLRDFTGKNRKFTGAAGIKTSSDGQGTAERVNEKGRLRFNDETDLLEYYNGIDWKAIDAPPVITSFSIDSPSQTNVTSGYIPSTQSGTFELSVNGSLFDTTGANVTLVGSGETLQPDTIVRNSANLLTATFTATNLDTGNDPYTVKVTNGSGLSAELVDAIAVDQVPVFTNAVDTIYTIFDSQRSSGTIAAADLVGATDPDGDTITYTVSVGALPTGCTLASATGIITWSSISAVGSDTTSTFTISAATSKGTSTRQFKITVKAPIRTTITSTGPGTFSVPEGVTSLSILMVAGGGTGGSSLGGGGGGGGMLEGTLTVTPNSSINYVLGAGGSQSTSTDYYTGFYGQNTTFGPIPGPGLTATATGGGFGCGHRGGPPHSFGDGSPGGQNSGPNNVNVGGTGGSGGGTGSSDSGSATIARGGYGTQGPSAGLTGYGNDGGRGGGGSPGPAGAHGGGGGGGAGGAGGDTLTGSNLSGDGGIGRVSTASGSPVYYAGGGGGSGYPPTGGNGANGGSGGGTNGGNNGARSSAAPANSGGGTGCGGHPQGGSGTGGPGIIIINI